MACRRQTVLHIYEEPTIYGSSYINHKQPRGKIYNGPFVHLNKEQQRKRKPYTGKSSESLQPWRSTLPFDALWTPKPITRTLPKQTFDPEFSVTYVPDEKIIKNRPRVNMFAAVNLDDIDDPETRKLVIQNMYTSDWKKISGEIDHMCTKRKIENTIYEDPSTLKLRYEYNLVTTWPLDWQEKCKEWNKNYPDNVCNQTELFWETFKYPYKPVPIGQDLCKDKVSEETRKEIRELIDKDELRLAFDKPKMGYAGYKPRCDVGPLRKQYIIKNSYEELLPKAK